MPRLELRHLSLLAALADADSFADAATRLNVTPSALTHRLKEAERRLGVTLVERGRVPPAFTDPGRTLLATAREVLRTLDAAETAASEAGDTRPVLVRLGASTLCGYGWLADLVRSLESSHPQVDLEVVMDVAADPVAAVKKRKIDAAVMPARTRDARLRHVALYRDEMVAVVPRGHRFAVQPFVEVRDFATETYVANNTQPEIGREYSRLFAPAGIRPQRVLRAGHIEAVIGVVRAGIGVTVSTRSTVAPFIDGGGLVLVPLTAEGQFVTWYGIHAADVAKAPIVREVMLALARVTAR
jgi:LysR family transcriptional regulator for metE and metH